MDFASTQFRRAFVLVPLLALLLAAAPLLLAVRSAAAQPLTFVVTTTGDEPDLQISDDRCDVSTADGLQCTLRAALQEANNTPGANTIEFDIPGPGLKTIQPASALPVIAQRTTINGYTQPGSSANTAATGTNAVLRIQLDGVNSGGGDGLDVTTGDNTLIRGLIINRFGTDGIEIDSGASDVKVTGNFIGTNSAGTLDRGNGDDGVESSGPDTIVGGANAAARNLISGNGNEGVRLESAANGSRVLGNLIGTTKTGTAPLGNDDHGINTSVDDTFIGGNSAGESNTIAFNATDGVAVQTAGAQNRILRNSIFNNGEQGIDLGDNGRTVNDANDADNGANTLQNFPVITVATSNTVQGTLNSTPNRSFSLRLFSNPGVSNEGKFFEAVQLTVTTNGAGNANFTFDLSGDPIPTNRTVTVTATGLSNTSEFSDAVAVVP